MLHKIERPRFLMYEFVMTIQWKQALFEKFRLALVFLVSSVTKIVHQSPTTE